jgi:hypothetical protein
VHRIHRRDALPPRFPSRGARAVAMLWFGELLDTPWGQLAKQRHDTDERAGLKLPDCFRLQEIALRDLRWGRREAFRDLLRARAIPYPPVGRQFASMLPPHTEASPYCRLDLKRRDLDLKPRGSRAGRPRKLDHRGDIVAALEGKDVEPLKAAIAMNNWPLEVRKHLVTMMFEDLKLPSTYKFVMRFADKPTPPDLYLGLRDVAVERWRRHLIRSGLGEDEAIEKILKTPGTEIGRDSILRIRTKFRDAASVTKTVSKTKPVAAVANDTGRQNWAEYGGSYSPEFNDVICRQAAESLWLKISDSDLIDKQFGATLAGLRGIGPKDECEGMMAAQLIAAHNAAMECYRRAMIPEQTADGRRENLTQANKLSRTFATVLEALNRHRGNGQQKVTVEHVHVHSGGQAVVGVVEPGGGDRAKLEDQSHARQIAHAPQPTMRRANEVRQPVPAGSNGEFSLQDARWNKPGCSEG